MKNITLSIKEHTLSDEYKPKFKNYDYVQTFDFENDDDIELLYEKVNLFVHTYYTFDKNIRSEKKFQTATAIFLDFDTKGTHRDSNIDEFLSSEFSDRYSWILYTSKSHILDEQECFHVILPLEENITDVLTLKSTYNAVFEEIRCAGLRCDFRVRDGARLIFPSMNMSECEDKHFDNFRFERHIGSEYLSLTYPTIEEISDNIQTVFDDPEDYSGSSDNEDEEYLTIFNNMSLKSRFQYVQCIVKHMNKENRRSGYKSIPYNNWVSLGFSFNKLFGSKLGLVLFKELSKGHPNDTEASIADQFRYLYSESYSSDQVAEMIIKQASVMKFPHITYFRYYFQAKHVFNSSESLIMYHRMIDVLLDDMGYDLVSHKDVKIYKYSSNKDARIFLMKIVKDGVVGFEKVTITNMKNIMSGILDVPVKYVSISVTDGIIRKFINMNGIYDITGMIKENVCRYMSDTRCSKGFVSVAEVKKVIADTRELVPTTMRDIASPKRIEQMLMKQGVILEKKVKNFKFEGYRKNMMAYKIDESKITTLNT